MKITKITLIAALMLAVGFTSCKPKDADVQASIETALKADPMAAGTTVSVKDGIATLAGECKDDACKAACEKLVVGVKGVKSVVNNCTITPVAVAPAPASTTVNVAVDATVQKKITDALKDIKGATVAFEGKKAMFSGTFTAAQKTTLQQVCGSAGVGADMTKATIK